ncbi:MAG: hypothetical protein HC769_21760 [Cyanobacteria bacterium CRU_2_1]|nr:hypothetical protein [Cyanobacteria bacterium CRU_2_1]
MSTILATFKIEPDRWNAFKAKAQEEEKSASSVLKDFIDHYLDGSIELPTELTGIDIDARIDAKLEKFEAEILGKSPA